MASLLEFAPRNEALYRCPDPIQNLKISVTFDGETRHFRWQRKIFSRFERDFYADEKNCVTDLERRYHQDVVRLGDGGDGVLFCYTDEDRFIPLEEYNNGADGDVFEVMHIMADLGAYVDEVWIKSEHVLCTIRYYEDSKLLLMNPDFTKTQPYLLQVTGETVKNYSYFIENACEDIDEATLNREEELCAKLLAQKLKLRAETVGSHFVKPPKNVTHIHLFFEIATATTFDNDRIYVCYYIDLPKNYTCEDQSALTGTTQASDRHFGFNFEVTLQCHDTGERTESPYVYFEVVSKDTWSRFRTEGLAYQCLPVSRAGHFEFRLNCVRICPEGVTGELRRFFIGDCGAHSDISWVGAPRAHEGNFISKYGVRTTPTGELLVKLNVVQQTSANLNEESPKHDFLIEKLQSSKLLKSVVDVVAAFKKARKNMIETRKNV